MKAPEPHSDGDRLLLRKEVAVELRLSRDKAVRHLIMQDICRSIHGGTTVAPEAHGPGPVARHTAQAA